MYTGNKLTGIVDICTF